METANSRRRAAALGILILGATGWAGAQDGAPGRWQGGLPQLSPAQPGTLQGSCESLATGLAGIAKDADGRPVSAEIALGLVDESVKYIQEDYAGDPRQFYYGHKRVNGVQTTSTLNVKKYVQLAESDGRLRDVNEVGANQGTGARRSPKARLYSVEPRSSQCPSRTTLISG